MANNDKWGRGAKRILKLQEREWEYYRRWGGRYAIIARPPYSEFDDTSRPLIKQIMDTVINSSIEDDWKFWLTHYRSTKWFNSLSAEEQIIVGKTLWNNNTNILSSAGEQCPASDTYILRDYRRIGWVGCDYEDILYKPDKVNNHNTRDTKQEPNDNDNSCIIDNQNTSDRTTNDYQDATFRLTIDAATFRLAVDENEQRVNMETLNDLRKWLEDPDTVYTHPPYLTARERKIINDQYYYDVLRPAIEKKNREVIRRNRTTR